MLTGFFKRSEPLWPNIRLALGWLLDSYAHFLKGWTLLGTLEPANGRSRNTWRSSRTGRLVRRHLRDGPGPSLFPRRRRRSAAGPGSRLAYIVAHLA